MIYFGIKSRLQIHIKNPPTNLDITTLQIIIDVILLFRNSSVIDFQPILMRSNSFDSKDTMGVAIFCGHFVAIHDPSPYILRNLLKNI